VSPTISVPGEATERADAAIASVMLAVVLTLTTRIFTAALPRPTGLLRFSVLRMFISD